MTKLLVDTNVYFDAMRGQSEACRELRQADELLMCPAVVGELLGGFRGGAKEKENRQVLRDFLSRPRVRIVPATLDTAEFYAEILTSLRRQGTPIPTNDIWIAASAMEHGATVVTRDTHFRQIQGLLLCMMGGSV